MLADAQTHYAFSADAETKICGCRDAETILCYFYIIPFINRVDLIKTCEEAGWNPAKENFANVYIIFLLQMQSDLLHLKSD